MKSKSVQQKLVLSFLIITLLAVLIGAFSVFGMRRLSSNSHHLQAGGSKGAVARELSTNLYRQNTVLYDLLLAPSTQPEARQLLEELDAAFWEDMEWLEQNSIYQAGRDHLAIIRSQYTEHYQPTVNAFLAAFPGSSEAGSTPSPERVRQELQILDQQILSFCEFADRQIAILAQEDSETAWLLMGITGTLILAAVGLSILLGHGIAASIAKPVKRLAQAAGGLAKGNVSVNLRAEQQDELGQLIDAFNTMTDGIREQARVMEQLARGDYNTQLPVRSSSDVMNIACNRMIDAGNQLMAQIKRTAGQVAAGADQIARNAQSLSTGAGRQAASIEALSANLAEVDGRSRGNAQGGIQAMEAFESANRQLAQSISSMEEMLQAMDAIDRSSQQITKVIKVIDEIAFQTNILSLNAAVEAARAGEQGKGFGMVAEEVRRLATKSAVAARETAALIKSSVETVHNGNRIVEQTSESLRQVSMDAEAANHELERLVNTSYQQAAGIQEINRSVAQISAVTQSTSTTAEAAAAAAEAMSRQAMELREMVSFFHLRKEAGPQPKHLSLPQQASDLALRPPPASPPPPPAKKVPNNAYYLWRQG